MTKRAFFGRLLGALAALVAGRPPPRWLDWRPPNAPGRVYQVDAREWTEFLRGERPYVNTRGRSRAEGEPPPA